MVISAFPAVRAMARSVLLVLMLVLAGWPLTATASLPCEAVLSGDACTADDLRARCETILAVGCEALPGRYGDCRLLVDGDTCGASAAQAQEHALPWLQGPQCGTQGDALQGGCHAWSRRISSWGGLFADAAASTFVVGDPDASGNGLRLRGIALDDGSIRWTRSVPAGSYAHVAVTGGGHWITVSEGPRVIVYNATTGFLRRTIDLPGESASQALLSADGATLVIASSTNQSVSMVSWRDLVSGQLFQRYVSPVGASLVSISRDALEVTVLEISYPNVARLARLDEGAIVATRDFSSPDPNVHSSVRIMDAAGSALLVMTAQNIVGDWENVAMQVRAMDAQTLADTRVLPTPPEPLERLAIARLSADGSAALVAYGNDAYDYHAARIDIASGETTWQRAGEGYGLALAERDGILYWRHTAMTGLGELEAFATNVEARVFAVSVGPSSRLTFAGAYVIVHDVDALRHEAYTLGTLAET